MEHIGHFSLSPLMRNAVSVTLDHIFDCVWSSFIVFIRIQNFEVERSRAAIFLLETDWNLSRSVNFVFFSAPLHCLFDELLRF